MRISLVVLVILFFTGCSDKKTVKKSYAKENVILNWYVYSNISSTSPHFIELTNIKTDSTVLIAKSKHAIKDLQISNDTIFIIHTKFNDLNSEISKEKKIFNYNIVFKEYSSQEIYLNWRKKNEERH